jgi:glycosyltransferase involved in cell wall biosynthesis
VTSIVLATLASGTPMGQQEYERQLAAHLPAVGVDVRMRRVRSLRSSLPGDARLPLTALGRAPLAVQHVAAAMTYRTTALVHRADLRLPAARCEVVTVHDLAPLRYPDEGTIPPRAIESLRHAKAVVCPSEFAARELRSLAGIDDPVVIHNGLDPSVWSEPDLPLLDALRLPDRFVLHSGGASQRKNLPALARAWARVADAHPDVGLVLCGPPDDRRARAFAGLPRVRMLGRVGRSVHLALTTAATVVVVPSLYEGFGFPALEAMARGTAVVAANAASLPEICGDAALLVEATGDGIADGLIVVLNDDAERTRLSELGPEHAREFSWSRAASSHAELYRSASARLAT